MSGTKSLPNSVDKHIGQRMQLRRNILGMSQKSLAEKCGVTFQQIQKYEVADNRISASRLFDISLALETPVSFFFFGLPGNVPEETKANKSIHVSEPKPDDPMLKTETLRLISMYWRLPNDQRKIVMDLINSLNNTAI